MTVDNEGDAPVAEPRIEKTPFAGVIGWW